MATAAAAVSSRLRCTTTAAAAVRASSWTSSTAVAVTSRRSRTNSLIASTTTITKRWKHSNNNNNNNNNQSQKSFSSLYEYPTRKEAPIVTRTTAKEAAAIQKSDTTTTPHHLHKKYHTNPEFLLEEENDYDDKFDDEHQLDELEIMARRQQQQQWLNTKLEGDYYSRQIESTPPPTIPPNVPQELLIQPTTQLTLLDNGVRVVSQETYGQVCTVGVLTNVGSRHEQQSQQQVGVVHLLELLAFHSTKHNFMSGLDILQSLQDWGGTSFCNTGREQTLHCIDILRPNVHKAMELLSQVVLYPQLTSTEVDDCKRAIEFQWLDNIMLPEIVLGELLQEAAYGGGGGGADQQQQQLGKPHFCPLEALPHLTSDIVQEFWHSHVYNNPKGIVIAGAGIGHDELVDMTQEYFGHLLQPADDNDDALPRTIPSTYTGGQGRYVQQETKDGFTRLALAYELGGWHSDDLVSTCVLQTLLGGGNSFSAGGPGKGMYSRLYRQVLNKYAWAESAEAFTAFHEESGLWGMSGSCKPNKVRDLSLVLAEHFDTLARDVVSDEELDRARNMLKCNVLTQLESRLVLFEDMGRQVLTYGHREDTETMCRKIDAVSKEDLQQLAQRALMKPSTIVAIGDDVSNVPTHEEVTGWFK